MESFEDSNGHSMTDSISLYERYLKSFAVVNSIVDNREEEVGNCEYEDNSRDGNDSCGSNVATADIVHIENPDGDPDRVISSLDNIVKGVAVSLESGNLDLCLKTEDSNLYAFVASTENSSATQHSISTERSDATDVPVSSEDSKSNCFKHPVFITSTMENSNNAMDSVPLFRNVRPSESVFKLPIRELSFNGTLKHVQKLKPIVDPISALTCNGGLLEDKCDDLSVGEKEPNLISADSVSMDQTNSNASSGLLRLEGGESTGDSQYEEVAKRSMIEDGSSKWNDQSHSSLEASFDSGVRSPDMFSDEDDAAPVEADLEPQPEPYWNFLKDFEAHDKRRVRKIEEALSGVLPPPSITTLKIDVTEMLNKYYTFLPIFNKEPTECHSKTPSKRVSFINIPEIQPEYAVDVTLKDPIGDISKGSLANNSNSDLNKSDNLVELKMCNETEAKETTWPDIMKCRYYDIYHNTNIYAESFERLALRYGERYVGAETESSVNVYSGGLQPSSASKRKAMRIKMAQTKSPSRRLSHLARRRQAFCSAATIGERAHSSSSKMVLIDRNFFPHRKLINTAERKSPRTRRTPGKGTPTRKTPKKTPAKTPKSSSSRKKAMRRLLMDGDNITRSQPRENLIKRALFISPENRKAPQTMSLSVPSQAMKSKRALFSSPSTTADTKSLDGTQSDHFMKRKRDQLGDTPEMGRSKIAKSLSFGGDSYSLSQPMSANRRASEMFPKRSLELNEIHKKKLVWAVSEALRVHGWRMSSPGFREKASSLARLTRRLLQLPTHKASLSNPHLSTSDTMLKLARQYVFAIIQGRTVEECFEEEQAKLSNTNMKLTGYISASAYQQLKDKPKQVTCTLTSQIKENRTSDGKQEPPRSGSKNVLQDKTVNIDSNSNSSSGLSMIDKAPLFKSNSMPSFEQAAKMRARRQISFDNLDFPKR